MQVAGLDKHSKLQWSLKQPHFNVRTSNGIPTLVVYLDETHSPGTVETKADKLFDLLRRVGGRNQRRLCIFRREHGEIRFVPIPALTRFDEANPDQTEFTTIRPMGT